MGEKVVMVNRAPGLTLWGAVVAERMGFDHDAAVTLAAVRDGRAGRGLRAGGAAGGGLRPLRAVPAADTARKEWPGPRRCFGP